MNPKKADKMATSVLYVISGIIVVILASLLLYILVRGLPHISWHFLTSQSKAYEVGGGIGIQLFNSIFLLIITMIIMSFMPVWSCIKPLSRSIAADASAT